MAKAGQACFGVETGGRCDEHNPTASQERDRPALKGGHMWKGLSTVEPRAGQACFQAGTGGRCDERQSSQERDRHAVGRKLATDRMNDSRAKSGTDLPSGENWRQIRRTTVEPRAGQACSWAETGSRWDEHSPTASQERDRPALGRELATDGMNDSRAKSGTGLLSEEPHGRVSFL